MIISSGSLIEEVEIAAKVKLNPLYIADRRDEIEFLRWTATISKSILERDNERKQVQLGTTKMRLQLTDVLEFENTLQIRIQELNLKLKELNNLRESDILINEIDTLETFLGGLSDLRFGDKSRAIEIAEADNASTPISAISDAFGRLPRSAQVETRIWPPYLCFFETLTVPS